MAAQDRPRANGESLPRVDEEELARIDNGIEAADRDDFATEEEVRAVFARWRELGHRNRRGS